MVVGLLFGFLLVTRLNAQSTDLPAFDTYSLKPHPAGPGPRIATGKTTIDPSTVIMLNTTAGALMEFAYDWKSVRMISNQPAWLLSDHFDLVAKSSPPANLSQQREMVRHLLAEEFKLACHREQELGPIYVLSAMSSPKLQLAKSDDPPQIKVVHTQAQGALTFVYTVTGNTMKDFADHLWSRYGIPVVDRTGITGRFDFIFSTTADRAMEPLDYFQDIQYQLHLRVRADRGPVEKLVIDHIAHPRQN